MAGAARRVKMYRDEIRQIVGLEDGAEPGHDELMAVATAALIVAAEAHLRPEGWADDMDKVSILTGCMTDGLHRGMMLILARAWRQAEDGKGAPT